MPTLAEVRQQYPQYEDLSDEQLLNGLHQKFYADMPYEDFAAKVGAPSKTAAQPASSFKRALGLTGRTIAQIGSDIALLPADLAVAAYNIGNQKPYEVTINGKKEMRGGPMAMPSADRDAFLDRLGLPRPEGRVENLTNIASRAAGGAGSISKIASTLPGKFAEMLARRPVLQTASGATAGGASEFARQEGAGPLGQFGAGLAGAFAPAALATRAAPLLPVMANDARAGAQATASARVTPGVATVENVVSATPELRATGGGHTFGSVGPDPSAGLSAPMARVAAEGQRLGMRMTPGQATGSKALQQMEAKLESQPMTSGPFNTIKASNAKVLNRESAKSIGESSDTVDDATMARAMDRISGVYDDVADQTPRLVTPGHIRPVIEKIMLDNEGLLPIALDEHPLVKRLADFSAKGSATGEQLQSLASKLGRAAHKEMTSPSGDRDLGGALFQIKDNVDDLLSQGLSVERAEAFARARQQYRNLILLTQRVGVVNPATGNVQGRSLASVLQSKDKAGYLRGGNQTGMYNAARFSQAFAPIVGDSGTATRMPLQGITDMLARIPLNIATRAYTSSPSISLALKAQAAARAANNYPRSIMREFQPGDYPAAGLFADQGQ